METTIQIKRWGNDLGVSIPLRIANEMSLKEGLYVNMQGDAKKIIIEHSKPNVAYNLTDMLHEITENNIHHSVDTGLPIGNEIW